MKKNIYIKPETNIVKMSYEVELLSGSRNPIEGPNGNRGPGEGSAANNGSSGSSGQHSKGVSLWDEDWDEDWD